MFPQILVNLRKEYKLTQYELADKLNFSRGQIANYEQGTREPDFDTLLKFADFFSVTTDFLLGRNVSNQNIDIVDFNERLLMEIGNLRSIEKIVGLTQRISISLEILRFVRNSELGLNFEEGIKLEDEWIANNQKS